MDIFSKYCPLDCQSSVMMESEVTYKALKSNRYDLSPSCMTLSELLILAKRQFPVCEVGH